MNEKLILENLRNVPNFPSPGIQFKDVSTLFKNPEVVKELLAELLRRYEDKGITKVVAIETRGFVMGSILANAIGAGLVMARKPGKLPADVFEASYEKEYGIDKIQIHKDALCKNDIVLIHDDLLATGGSMKAALDIVKRFNPKKIYINFLLELKLEGLGGVESFDTGYNVQALLKIEN